MQHRILLVVDVHNICWMGGTRRFVTKHSVPTVKMRERTNASTCFKLKCYVFLFRDSLVCLSGKFCLLKGLNFLKFTFYKLLHSRQSSGSVRGAGKKERPKGCYAVLLSGDGYCPHELSASQPKPHIDRGDDCQAQFLSKELFAFYNCQGREKPFFFRGMAIGTFAML